MERHQLPMGKAAAPGRGSSLATCSRRPTRTPHQRTSGEPKGEPGCRHPDRFCLPGWGGSRDGRPGAQCSQKHLPWDQQWLCRLKVSNSPAA